MSHVSPLTYRPSISYPVNILPLFHSSPINSERRGAARRRGDGQRRSTDGRDDKLRRRPRSLLRPVRRAAALCSFRSALRYDRVRAFGVFGQAGRRAAAGARITRSTDSASATDVSIKVAPLLSSPLLLFSHLHRPSIHPPSALLLGLALARPSQMMKKSRRGSKSQKRSLMTKTWIVAAGDATVIRGMLRPEQ